jgi:hypothetical protein
MKIKIVENSEEADTRALQHVNIYTRLYGMTLQKMVIFKRYVNDSQISCYRVFTRAPFLMKQMCRRTACLDQFLALFIFTPCTINIKEFIYFILAYDIKSVMFIPS